MHIGQKSHSLSNIPYSWVRHKDTEHRKKEYFSLLFRLLLNCLKLFFSSDCWHVKRPYLWRSSGPTSAFCRWGSSGPQRRTETSLVVFGSTELGLCENSWSYDNSQLHEVSEIESLLLSPSLTDKSLSQSAGFIYCEHIWSSPVHKCSWNWKEWVWDHTYKTGDPPAPQKFPGHLTPFPR
jgi:uncharacterized protein YfiM (DUF2279 family)